MTNKNIMPVKNANKKIICSFLGENGNINLSFEESSKKFFEIEANKIIRPDAFRFYYKKLKDGKVPITAPEKTITEKVIKSEVKKDLTPVVSKPVASKPPTKSTTKAVVKKTTVVKAAKI